MEPCYACGASLRADSEWCGQCYAPSSRAPSTPSLFKAPSRHVSAPPALAPLVVRTRWRKTTTTFGPIGRVIATFGLVLPFLFFVIVGILTGGMTVFGAAIWGFIIMPWGLRDVWKSGQLPAK